MTNFDNCKDFCKRHFWKLLAGVLAVLILVNHYGLDDYVENRDLDSSAAGEAYYNETEMAYMEKSMISSPSSVRTQSDSMLYEDESGVDVNVPESERKIIKNANITVQVEDGEEAYFDMKSDLEQYDAFIESVSVNETYYEGKPKEAYSTVRVNIDQFEQVMELIRSYGYVKSESVSNSDVTKQYTDWEAELTNLQLREEKVREFYEAATNVVDTLAIYQELSSIQAQIDRITRNLEGLDDRASYSTIYISFTPEIKITDFSNPDWNLKLVWKAAVNNLIDSLHWLAELALTVIVYSVIWIPLLLIAIFIKRRLNKRR